MRNIIILDNEPYSDVRRRNFFIDEFVNSGYRVYHYSLTNYLTIAGTVSYKTTEKSEIAFTLNNKKEIKKMLDGIKVNETFLFVELHFNRNTFFVFNHLYNIKAIWGRLSYYTNPAVNLYKSSGVPNSERVKRYKDFNYVKFAFFVKLFRKRINKITQSHVLFKTGLSDFNFPKSKKMVNINYFDLEAFNVEKNNQAVVQHDYIVFNDIFLPYHPDLQRINKGSEFIDPTTYFKELNVFFDKVEAQYGMEVIIAAHPKAKYKAEFGIRKVMYGHTANLIINSRLLITHLSISTDYALFSKKPVLFFHTPSLYRSQPLQYMINYMKIYAEKINALFVDSTSDELPLFDEIKVDVEAYDNVVTNFFGQLYCEKSNFEIILNEVSCLLNSKANI